MAKRLEDAGAAALVMYSLFEEEVIAEEEQLTRLMEFQDLGHGEADSYLPLHPDYKTGLDEYLEQLQALKSALEIPVVASLNGATESGWVEHGRELEEAGADALELNIYFIPDVEEFCDTVEARYVSILRQLKDNVINLSLTVFFDTASGTRVLGLFSCLSGTCVLDARPLPHRPYAAITARKAPVAKFPGKA